MDFIHINRKVSLTSNGGQEDDYIPTHISFKSKFHLNQRLSMTTATLRVLYTNKEECLMKLGYNMPFQ